MMLKLASILAFFLVVSGSELQDRVDNRFADIQSRMLDWYLTKFNLTSEDDINKVIGGVDAKPGEAPFQAQLHIKSAMSNSISFTCGGSIINSRTILSAGHCVDYFNNYRIRYGSNSRSFSPYALAEVAEIKVHPQYNLDTITNDIALFILTKPIQPGSNVAAVGLQQQSISPATSVTLFGFGLMNGKNQNSLAEKLQKAIMQTVNDRECNQFFQQVGIRKTPGHLCVAATNRGSCNGDSGGPLLVSSSGLQVGIVSFGLQNCPPGAIDVFTNVPYYMNWISANMVGEPANPGPEDPDQPDPPKPPPTTQRPTIKPPGRPVCRWVCE